MNKGSIKAPRLQVEVNPNGYADLKRLAVDEGLRRGAAVSIAVLVREAVKEKYGIDLDVETWGGNRR